jgi:hypothetical protein
MQGNAAAIRGGVQIDSQRATRDDPNMAAIQVQSHCATCGTLMPHNAVTTNHILHLLMSVFTIGIWVVVWLVVTVKNADAPITCAKCGTKRKR